MKFQYLEAFHKNWNDILVIGRTIEQDDKRYHIAGMTLADESKLYIIEPYSGPEHCSDLYLDPKHSPDLAQHMVEKTVTLNVGKSRSFIPAELLFYIEKVDGWEEKV